MERYKAIEQLENLVGQDLRDLANRLGITVFKNGKLNKGWAGQTVERYLGLPLNSARSPNLGSWELKVVSLKRDCDGRFVVKETMAITMLDPEEVKVKEFSDSHLFTKLRKLIMVSREYKDRDESSSKVLGCNAFELEGTLLFDDVSADYELIRNYIGKGTNLSGRMGKYVQPRTKGSGHGSTSRAFYARKGLVEFLIGQKETPLKAPASEEVVDDNYSLQVDLPLAVGANKDVPSFPKRMSMDCWKHAGKGNLSNRSDLDDLMGQLPLNQSGKGRHRCPYCAFEAGFRAGIASVSNDR